MQFDTIVKKKIGKKASGPEKLAEANVIGFNFKTHRSSMDLLQMIISRRVDVIVDHLIEISASG